LTEYPQKEFRASAHTHPPDLAALARDAGLGAAVVYVRSLVPGGPSWSCDDGRWIYPASLIKLPLAVATTVAIEAGRLAWESPVTVGPRNMTVNDTPSPMAPGYVASVDELVTLMLQRSDNVATNVLFDVLDRACATDDMHALGFSETAFRRKLSGALPLIDDPEATGRNSHPGREASALLTAIAENRVPQAPALRAILATSWWDVKLSRGLEPGDTFAHKTGDTDEVSHDAGILTLSSGARWTITVYTDLPSSEEHDVRFGTFMRALRPFLLMS
jgi:beta-lactamase class A